MTISENGMGNFGHRVKILVPFPEGIIILAYDIKRDRVVLSGGFTRTGGSAILLGDTWELRIGSIQE
jgi:hypothetical protein